MRRASSAADLSPPLEVDVASYSTEEVGCIQPMKTELARVAYYLVPAPLSAEQVEELEWLAAAVFRVTAAWTWRASISGWRRETTKTVHPEVNPCGLSPGYSDLCVEANAPDGHTRS